MWLAICSESHQSCRSEQQHRPPSRLVSIGSNAVKLVITKGLQTLPRYATLSYCWGQKPFTKLKRHNLDIFLDRGIPLEELPQTFVDAIDVTRQLGLEFIWIDALCIIQEETDNIDWEIEAGHMRSVYGGSFVNLAASTATSVHSGFLQRPKYHTGFIARVTTSDRCTVQRFQCASIYEEATTETHLASRAWAFQERLLPPRTIHFGDMGLFWECRSQISSEFLPDALSDLRGSILISPEQEPLDWTRIVSQYSRTALTYSSDRLPALSGIAARQHEVTGDKYLAGMWSSSLITQLPWYRLSSIRHRPMWRAPTWSWMSVDGHTEYWPSWDSPLIRVMREFIQVLNAWTKPSGADPYGAITGAGLTLSCSHLILGHLVAMDTWVPQELDDAKVDTGTEVYSINVDCLEDASAREIDIVYLLPIIGGKSGVTYGVSGTHKVEEQHMIRGLVLRTSGSSKDRFCRVGSFDIRSLKWNYDPTTGNSYTESAEYSNLSSFLGQHGQWHTITIE